MNATTQTDTSAPAARGQSFHNLARFSDLTGFGFGYPGGARDACALMESNRDLLTYDGCGNLTGTTDKATLRKRVADGVGSWETLAPSVVPAMSGHLYAFRRYGSQWFIAGLVENTPAKREWWAHYWRTTPQSQGTFAGGQKAEAVAFLPYAVNGSNFVTQTQVDRDAVAVL